MGGHSKFARCSAVVIEIFSKIMQELLGKYGIPSSSIYKIILDNKKFRKRLSTTDMISIQTLCTDGFTKLDVTLIYKIVKFYNFIPPPTRQWGEHPHAFETEIGDDVERIRRARNDLVHRIDCKVTDTEFNAFFVEFIELGRRIDVYLEKPSNVGFRKEIADFKTCSMDEDLVRKYIKALEEIADLKEKASLCINEKVVRIYYDKAIEEIIRDIKDDPASSTTPVRIIVKGIDDAGQKAALLNSLIDELNNESVSIQFKHAREGCIVLHVTILNKVLQDQSTLVYELTNFLGRVFRVGNLLELNPIAEGNIILTADEHDEDGIDDFEITEEIYSSSDGKQHLVIDLEVNNDILRTDDTFQNSICGFLDNILTKTNGNQFFPEKDVTAIVLPGANQAHCQMNSSTDLFIAVNDSIQDMDLDQDIEHAQVATCKSSADILSKLGLEIYYPDKIALIDIVKIQPSHSNIKLSNIPWVFLENLISLNFNARDKILEEYLEHPECASDECNMQVDFLDDLLGSNALLNRVNPIDLTVAIFNCCSPVVKQIVASKMFMCRLAIPFVFPQYRNEAMLVSMWPIRQIAIEGEISHIGAVDCPCNVVSFVRIGYTSISKSRMINEIISDQYHCTFFNKDSPLGSTTRWISNGLIEIAWYIPSPNTRLLSNVTACLNLRGDCDVHRQQLHVMSHLSDAIVIMVDIYELKNERFMQLLKDVYNNYGMVILSIDAIRCNKGVLRNELKNFLGRTTMYKDRTKVNIMAVEGNVRNFSDLKKELRNYISELVSKRSVLSLWKRLQAGICKEINLDENKIVYSAMKKAADKITSFIPKSCSNIKVKLLPLQGEPWKEWSQNLKTVNKSSVYKTMQEKGLIRNKMIEARRTQFHICENLGPFMNMFIDTLQQVLPLETESTVFVVWLKMFFDERSRNVLPEYLERYKSKWQELKSAQDQNQNDAAVTIAKLRLSECEYQLAEASFGFEHLCREMGQMYEAMMECTLPAPVKYQTIDSVLPQISARLLLMGHPFEVMDGDTANVPLLWVKAVLEKLRENIGDKKLLALSVLGIQSSGKSTLLNTMFGLQFAVSAGRCTRGVYMQLVPVLDNKNYDYVLVIDTEGLRAPELAHEKHSHDNELATFVVGLGDVTIVNVKGENNAEVRDVLQIVVHAFLRLKLANDRLNLKQKCVFVHQNVSAPDANDKLIQQRTRFVDILDKMTQEAAGEENIADINAFSQVIDFDSEANVWYFSDLWYGDPPMAPANPGYSKCVNRVKDALFSDSSMMQRETYLTITDTISRIEDLWIGILKDDFVFSFRNSLEVKAYNSMERQCQSLTWTLEKYVLEFIRSEAKSMLVNCLNDDDFENAFSSIVALLATEKDNKVESLYKDLDSFVERSTLKDVMIQWTQSKKTRLRVLGENLVFKAKTEISNTKEEIKIQRLKIREKTNHEMAINELARNLAVKMQGKTPDRDKLEGEFNHLWSSWINHLGLKDDIAFFSIAEEIDYLLYEKFPSDAAFFSRHKRFKADPSDDHFSKLEGSISAQRISHDHFSRHSYVLGFGKEKTDNCRNQTVDIINQTFREIDSRLLELDSQDIRFDMSYVTEIMNIIVNDIDEHNYHVMNDYRFNLLPPFRAMIVKHVALHLSTFFTNLNERYNKKHSPKSQIEMYKGTALALFINLVEQKTEDVIAVGFFQEAMIKTIVEHVTELLPIDVQESILLFFSNAKFSLMRDIMVNLANANKFEEYKAFIQDPTTFAKIWITKLTTYEMFERKEKEETKYAYLAKSRVHQIFCHLRESIQKATETCTKPGHSNFKHWIDNFLKHVAKTNYLPLSCDILIHVQSRKVSDIGNFSKMLLDDLEDTESTILRTFQASTGRTVKWKENPIPKIMNRLWGCEAKCMFCFEPCKNTDKDHTSLEFPHQCIQHRPMGIRGFHKISTDKLVVDFCNYSVSTETAAYRWHKDDKDKYYKDYKKFHPDWDILPSSDVSKYWMWVFCKYQHELVEMYDTKLPDIPAHWWNITKEQAIESISSTS